MVTKFISMIIEKNGILLTMAFPIQDNNWEKTYEDSHFSKHEMLVIKNYHLGVY